MAKIFDNPVSISLSAATPVLESPHVTVGALTSKIALIIKRPRSTGQPVNWDADSTIRTIVTMEVDGQQYFARGQASGGIRTDREGNEVDYKLVFSPPVVNVDGVKKRIGQTGTTLRGWIRLEWVKGTIQTEVLLAETEEAPV